VFLGYPGFSKNNTHSSTTKILPERIISTRTTYRLAWLIINAIAHLVSDPVFCVSIIDSISDQTAEHDFQRARS